MSGFTDAIANQILAQIFLGGPAYEAPDPMWLALLTAEPVGGVIDEVNYGNYERMEVLQSQLAAPVARRITNTVAYIFPACVDFGDAATHAALMDTQIDGDIIMSGALPSALTINIGTIPTVAVGSLGLTIPS